MTEFTRRDELNGQLDRLERLGRLISAFGVPLMLLVFVGWYSGWVPSPLLRATESIAGTLKNHDERVGAIIQERAAADRRLADSLVTLSEQIRRQTNTLRVLACASIREADVRAACLRD